MKTEFAKRLSAALSPMQRREAEQKIADAVKVSSVNRLKAVKTISDALTKSGVIHQISSNKRYVSVLDFRNLSVIQEVTDCLKRLSSSDNGHDYAIEDELFAFLGGKIA